jgi:hypothetical protein
MATTETDFHSPERNRLSIDVSPVVMSLLDNVSRVSGVPKSQIVYGALLDHMADLVERTAALIRADGELKPTKPQTHEQIKQRLQGGRK